MAGEEEQATATRPLPVRCRVDLEVVPHSVRGIPHWAVKDPLALQYYRLGPQEWFLLNQFDGVRSVEEIKQRFDRQFAPVELGDGELLAFIRRAQADGLLLLNASGQGQQLWQLAVRRGHQERFGRLLSILAIRFRGLDPQRLLNATLPVGRLLFHPLMAWGIFLMAAGTLGMMILQAEVVRERLPSLDWFLQGDNLLWMMIALSLVKVLHELGHGFACHHFGGRCHEMGVMLLVFTPCLYCNVSDAWMLPSRWQRIVISAAGIYVELALASLCALGWYFTHPGVLNAVLLNVVFICSVNTLFLNGNPLLRYDGYYILSDLVDVPNLAAQARAAVGEGMRRLFLRQEAQPGTRRPLRWGLISYGVASFLYRLFVVASIIWIIHHTFKTYEMQAVGQLLIGVVLLGLFLPLIVKLRLATRHPGGWRMLSWFRVGCAAVLLVGATTFLLLYPFPSSVTAPVAVEPGGATHVYAPDEGWLQLQVEAGAQVAQGDRLGTIENRKLQRQAERIADAIREYDVRIESLAQRLGEEAEIALQLAAAESERAELRLQQEGLEAQRQRLQMTAEVAGQVLPPPPRVFPQADRRVLTSWEGTPLDSANQGCYLQRGDLICLLGEPSQFRVVMYVNQQQIDRIRVDQSVRVRLDQFPEQVCDGRVVGISAEQVLDTQSTYAAAAELATRPDGQGQVKPLETAFRVTIRLESSARELKLGSGGRGRIATAPRSYGARLLSYLRRTVRFEL